jgi:UDP-N-acetylmuramoylalanine--D-glutamate ligase
MDLTGKNILVVGLARTGVALAHFLVEAGARVTVTDMAPAAELAEMRAHLQGLPVTEELGVPEPADLKRYDLILPSPGVPPELPWLKKARRRGTPVWGELELAGHFLTRPVIAVSGTNGKTTTTTLVGKFLAASGCAPWWGATSAPLWFPC